MSHREMYKSNRRRNPSFSSSLLDSIYRSIDGESNGQEEEEEEEGFSTFYRGKKFVMKEEKNFSSAMKVGFEDKDRLNLQRAIMIESWMEKKRSSNFDSVLYNSTSGSSDSSYGGGRGGRGGGGGVFSSSEADSSYSQRKSRSSSSSAQRMKLEHRINGDNKQTKKNREGGGGGGFTKTKLRALKIYGELKKVKQPISPVGRISSFLNSIFNSGSAKKVKMCSVEAAMEDVSFDQDHHHHHHHKPKSTCSSTATSSFSRSCLSKTPSKLSGNGHGSGGGAKRSVRFYPVSVIVDEDCRPCGHKCIYEDDDPTLMPKIVKSSAVKEELIMRGSRDYLTSTTYQKKNVNELDFRRFGNYIDHDYGDGDCDDDDDDAGSCSSSDLFELDHLIGIGRYREELPVYETTNLKTNQAIANGFIH